MTKRIARERGEIYIYEKSGSFFSNYVWQRVVEEGVGRELAGKTTLQIAELVALTDSDKPDKISRLEFVRR